MADIFISYAREDRPRAEQLARALQRQGLGVWWDLESLRSGQSFNRAIQEALEQAKCVIVLWSGASVASKWVESEAYWAWDHNKLHSVRLEDALRLPVPFNTIHACSLTSWDGGADFPELQRLTEDIAAVVGPSLPEPKPEQKPASKPAPPTPPQPEKAPQSAGPVPTPSTQVEWPVEPGPSTVPESESSEVSVAPRGEMSPVALGFSLLGGVGALMALALYLGTPEPERAPAADPVTKVPVEQRRDSADEPDAPADPVPKTPAEPSREITDAPDAPTASAAQPLETFRDCPDCPEMLIIPAGSFQMGSPEGEGVDDERPRHEVRIAKPFAIGKTEVTFDQWEACVQAGGCSHEPSDEGWGRGLQPVINVSWPDARGYAAWLSKRTGKPYRLPTEAEWEYAARAGTETAWSFGGDEGDLARHAWYAVNSGRKPHPVGRKEPNPWGLKDVHGNVWEWVQDCWNDSYQGAPSDGSARESGDCGGFVVRGGSWHLPPAWVRSASRAWNLMDYKPYNAGFRLAQDL